MTVLANLDRIVDSFFLGTAFGGLAYLGFELTSYLLGRRQPPGWEADLPEKGFSGGENPGSQPSPPRLRLIKTLSSR